MITKRLFPLSRRSVLIVTTVLGLIAILVLVIVSPFALEALAHSKRDWSQLSNIGQTYGAISALLSSLALVGVVVSLLYQARDSQTAHEQVSRTLQHDLLKMELADLSLMNAFGAPYNLRIASDFTSMRQFLFIHMWVSFLAGNYAIGESSKVGVRNFAANELFRSAAGRSYWEAVGRLQLGDSKGRRNQFFQLLDEEYKKALRHNVPVSNPVPMNDHPAASHTRGIQDGYARRLGLVAASVAIGAAVGRLWRRRDNQSNLP